MAHPKGDISKPVALSREVQASIVESLAKGNYLSTACGASGITYRGFRHWQKRWEEGDPVAQQYSDFFHSIETAICVGEGAALDTLRVGQAGWQAQAWFLERRFPQRWGRKDRTPVPPKPPKPIEQMDAEELAAYERELDKGKDRG